MHSCKSVCHSMSVFKNCQIWFFFLLNCLNISDEVTVQGILTFSSVSNLVWPTLLAKVVNRMNKLWIFKKKRGKKACAVVKQVDSSWWTIILAILAANISEAWVTNGMWLYVWISTAMLKYVIWQCMEKLVYAKACLFFVSVNNIEGQNAFSEWSLWRNN